MHDPALTPLRWTFSWPVIRNSLIVGAIVGTILNMINQGEYIAGDGPINWVTVRVPGDEETVSACRRTCPHPAALGCASTD